MSRRDGFTLVELMIVIAIIGILSATAMPFYSTWERRAVNNEARLMAKSILEAEVLYFVYGEDFYPESGTTYFATGVKIFNNDSQTDDHVKDAKEKLRISIPTGHDIDYFIQNDGNGRCDVTVWAYFGPDTVLYTGYATRDGEIKLLFN